MYVDDFSPFLEQNNGTWNKRKQCTSIIEFMEINKLSKHKRVLNKGSPVSSQK